MLSRNLMGRLAWNLATARRWLLHSSDLSQVDQNIRCLVIDTAWQGLMMGGVFTFLSVFAVRLGASNLQVSLLTSLPSVIMVVLSIPASQVVQRQRNLVRFTNLGRIPHRASILLVALLPFFAGRYLIETILVVWTIKTVAIAFIDPSWVAVVAEVIPPQRRAAVNGGRWALLSIVTAAAVAVFGYVLDRVVFPVGYQIVFTVSFLGGVMGMFPWRRIVLPEETEQLVAEGAPRVSLSERLRRYLGTLTGEPQFVRFLLTTSVLRIGMNLPAALYSIYWIRHLEASDLWIGWQATAGKIAPIVGYYLWGRVATRRGHHLVLLICALGVGLYPVLTGLVPSQLWLPAVALVQGFFVTGIDLAFFDTLLHVSPRKERPRFVAVNSVFAYLALSLAPLAGSALADWLGIRVAFYVAGAVHVVAVLLFLAFRVGDEESGSRE